MSSVRFREFRKSDFLTMDLRGTDREAIAASGFADISAEKTVGLTMLDERGLIIACAGIRAIRPGVAEAWMFTTPKVCTYVKTLLKEVRRMVPYLMDINGIHRLQAHVLADFDAGRKFIMRVGFVQEGLCPGYGANHENFVRYARVI